MDFPCIDNGTKVLLVQNPREEENREGVWSPHKIWKLNNIVCVLQRTSLFAMYVRTI